MAIYCEIKLHKPSNGAFIGAAGTIISGDIKYTVDEDTVFNKITISLKGHGRLHVEETRSDENMSPRRYIKNETYIDVDKLIHTDEKGAVVPAGSHETSFTFELFKNIPPTLDYKKYINFHHVKCEISYYIRIKFSRPGFMNFSKRLKKEITIISSVLPLLPRTPVMYGGQKTLTQLFTSRPSIINVKASILNSVLKCGDKIELLYEISNDTDVVIKTVETKLVEIYKFPTATNDLKAETDMPKTDSKAVSIQSGDRQALSVEITLPTDGESLEFSNLVTREFFVFITAHLPSPHSNYVLQIPVQIGNIIEETTVGANTYENEPPPSYFECMYVHEDTNIGSKAGTSRDNK